MTARACILGAGMVMYAHSAWALLPIQHWTEANGARVWLVESPAIPMVDVQVDFDAGARRDPPQQIGLASAAAAMTSKGVRAGADNQKEKEAALDENALGEAWADLGASFEASAERDGFVYSMRSLTDPELLAKALALASRQIGEPSFPQDVWQRERARWEAAIKESDTKPATVASKAFAADVYGKHPYGFQTTAQSLQRINATDLQAFHKRYVQTCAARVSIVGAVNKEQAQQLVRKLLSRLPAKSAGDCAKLPEVPQVKPLAKAVEQDIPFQSAQSHVIIGQPGIKRDNPDFLAILVGNHILGGGGFTSRLTQEVREKRGLSYSVGSGFSPGLDAGAFVVGLQTRPDQAAEAVKVSREVVKKFVEEGPSDEELRAAKDNLIGGFALRIDSNRKLLGNVVNIAWNNLPLDYLDHWTERVEALTVNDIRSAFQRMLQPDRMVTVVVGGKQ
ncbi:M16 family metallopeptidase [Diaphorobacter aerolatus]|nr:pitrilysin family protein [Diaphorobacter aerolatus]